jgi:integrase
MSTNTAAIVATPTAPVRMRGPHMLRRHRTVPLPQVVVDVLAAHMAAFPPGEHGLIFTQRDGRALNRDKVVLAFRKAAPPGTRLRDLRHYYASLLIRHGESVKVVQSRLGHASAKETLDTYSHLWPDSEDLTRAAVDEVLGATTQMKARSRA